MNRSALPLVWGAVRPGARLAPAGERRAVRTGAICPGVVGHDALDTDAGRVEGDQGELERCRRTGGALVRNGHDDRLTAAIVDDHLEVVVARAMASVAPHPVAAVHAVATAVRDPAELLVVLVHEGARMTELVSADGQTRRPVQVSEPGHPVPTQHRGDRRGRVAQEWSQAIGSPAPFLSRGNDAGDLVRRRRARRTVGSGRPVDEAGQSFGPKSADPLVAGCAADAHRLRSGRDRPALVEHPCHEQTSPKDVEAGSRMSHESLLTVWIFNNPNRARRLSLVNNVFGDDT